MVPSYGRGMLGMFRKKTRITHPQHASMKKCGPCIADFFLQAFQQRWEPPWGTEFFHLHCLQLQGKLGLSLPLEGHVGTVTYLKLMDRKKLLQQDISKHTLLLPSEHCEHVIMECVCVYIYIHETWNMCIVVVMVCLYSSRWEDCGHPVLSATFLPDAPVIACGLRCLAVISVHRLWQSVWSVFPLI